ALAGKNACLDERTNALFQEERVAFGPVDEEPLELTKPWIVSDERPEQLIGACRRQRVDPELSVKSLASPAVLVLRAIVDAEEHTSRGQTLDERIENDLSLGVDPVKVLEDQQQWLDLTLAQEYMLDGAERALSAMRRFESEERIVGR